MLKRASAWIQGFAMGLGAPGLFLLAFVDSSFLALPEVVDILLVWMVVANPDRWLLYGVMATAGSVAGCYTLYALARRGGEAFLRKRLRDHHIDRAMVLFRRYGVLSLVIPSISPPPVPFKPFILMAGVAGMTRARFLTAITAGRGVRYIGEALLALWYGQKTLTYIHDNLGRVLLGAGIAILVIGLIYYRYRKLAPKR